MQHQFVPLRQERARRIGYAVIVVAVTAVVLATLTPAGEQNTESIFACVFCGDQALADVLRNAVLYLPLGVGLALAGVRPRRVVLAGAVLSAAVELTQIALPGRDSSIGDVMANTGGAALGVLVVLSAPLWLRPPRRRSGTLALCWAVGITGVWGLTGWLLAPSFPKTVYYGQWTPNLGYIDWYRGKVLDARVGGQEIRSRRVSNSDALRQALLDGAPIDVLFVAGPNTSRLSSIFSIYDDRQQEIVLIGPRENDLVLRYATQAARFRLDQPELRSGEAGAKWRVGDTLSVTVRRSDPGWMVGVGSAQARQLGYTIAAGWTLLFYPRSQPDWLLAALNMAWMTGLLLPVGYWLRATPSSAAAVGICVVAAAGTPRLAGLLGTPYWLWIAMAIGLLLGAAASRGVGHLLHLVPDSDPPDP